MPGGFVEGGVIRSGDIPVVVCHHVLTAEQADQIRQAWLRAGGRAPVVLSGVDLFVYRSTPDPNPFPRFSLWRWWR